MTSQQPEAALPSPRRLMNLLEASGWERVSGRGDLYARLVPPSSNVDRGRRSIVIPLQPEAPDFVELMRSAVDALRAEPNESAALALLSQLMTSPADQFAFSKETAAPKGWIQWEGGETLIHSARGLLVASAKSAREHLTYFGNKYGQFANRFLDEVMMGQTAVGSYVVRAYVPVDRPILLRGGAEAEQGAHFIGQDAIASRDISLAVTSTLSSTMEAIDHFTRMNSLSAFKSPELSLSYESVTAVKNLAQNADYANIKVTWEQGIGVTPDNEQEFTFTSSAVPVLERAANDLVKPEPTRSASAFGTVHLLSRSESGGPGVIGITTLDAKPAKKVRVHLEEDDYHRALTAHDQGRLVRVGGNLEKEGNLSWLYQARIIEIAPPPAPESGQAEPDSRLF